MSSVRIEILVLEGVDDLDGGRKREVGVAVGVLAKAR